MLPAPAEAGPRAISAQPLPEEVSALYFARHWNVLRRHWRALLALSALGGLLGLAVAALQTPLYHAAVVVEIQGITDNLLKSPDGNPNAGADPELLDIQTQIRIIQSATLVQRALNRVAGPEPAFRHASNSLKVSALGPTRLIEIAADSPDPRAAAAFVNALAAAFIDQHIASRWQGAERAAARLSAALEDMRGKLEQSENALQLCARDSGLLLPSDHGSVSEDRLRLLQSELSQAEAERVARQARLDAVSRASGAALAAVVSDPAIQDAQTKLTEIRRQLAELAVIYTPDYAKVKRLEAQIAPLESAIAREVAGTQERTRSLYAESLRREELLRSAYDAQAALVSADAARGVHYDVLRREVDSTRAIYDTMLARVKESAIASAMRSSNVRVLDAAKPPPSPFQPRRGQSALLGLVAGLFLGVVVVVTRDQTDRVVRLPGDLALYLRMPEFGAVPSASPARLAVGSATPRSPFSESFRSIRASLLLAAPASLSQVLAVVSANPSEGKTTVVAHLAISLAEIGKRVLVIDGDLRCPRLHHVFGAPNQIGLVDLLAGAALPPAFHQTHRPGLQILPAGLPNSASPDLLHSPRLLETLDHARKNFDIVLIDTPPMLHTPDARVIGRAAGAVLIVVRAGKTNRDAALAMHRKLTEDGTVMTGCVLNDCEPFPGYNARRADNFPFVVRSGTPPAKPAFHTAKSS